MKLPELKIGHLVSRLPIVQGGMGVGISMAGLASAVYAASEGLDVVIVDSVAPGGQASTSSKIENYLGFPQGISGADLTRRARTQAQRLGAEALGFRQTGVLYLADGADDLEDYAAWLPHARANGVDTRLLTRAEAEFTADTAVGGLNDAYRRDESDEFVQPTAIHPADELPVRFMDGQRMNYLIFS